MITKRLRDLYHFIGSKVTMLLGLEIFIGTLWFAIEAAFIFVLQGFLVSIGFMATKEVILPVWYPTNVTSNLVVLLLYGVFRSFLLGLKKYLPSRASIEFSSVQRKRILALSLKTKHCKSTPELISYFTELTGKSGQFILNFALSVSLAVSSMFALAFCFRLAPVESLLGLGLSVIFFFPFKFLNRTSRALGKQQSDALTETNKVLMEGVKNLFLLKIYNLVDFEIDKGNRHINSYESAYNKHSLISSLIASTPFFLGMLIICIVTYVSRTFLKTDSHMFVAFLYLFLRLNQSLSALLSSMSLSSFYKESFLKLYSWCGEYKEPTIEVFHTTLRPVSDNIYLNSVSFFYNKEQSIFEDLTITIAGGDFFLIKGPSGSGKSTFLKLLFGLEVPTKGEIFINGLGPSQYMNNHSQEIGYVGPEPFLIPATVKENLLYGNTKAITEDDIWSSLDKLGLKKIIEEMPLGLNEHLYEDTQLSTGQKQRLSFARALLREPRILILDEATANIDHSTEKMILSHLNELKGRVTILVISHRDSFDSLSDKLLEVKGNSLCNLVVSAS